MLDERNIKSIDPLNIFSFCFLTRPPINQEANATFRILLNESTRRLKVSAKKFGSSIEKSRPYYEALEKSRVAQIECQKAAVKFQRANGKSIPFIHVLIT